MNFIGWGWGDSLEKEQLPVPPWLSRITERMIRYNPDYKEEIQRIVEDKSMHPVWGKMGEAADSWCNSLNWNGASGDSVEDCKETCLRKALRVLFVRGGEFPDKKRLGEFQKIADGIHELKVKILETADSERQTPDRVAKSRIVIKADYSYGWDFIHEEAGREAIPRKNLYAFLTDLEQHFRDPDHKPPPRRQESPEPESTKYSDYLPERFSKNEDSNRARVLFGELADWFESCTGRPKDYRAEIFTAIKVALNTSDFNEKAVFDFYESRRSKLDPEPIDTGKKKK